MYVHHLKKKEKGKLHLDSRQIALAHRLGAATFPVFKQTALGISFLSARNDHLISLLEIAYRSLWLNGSDENKNMACVAAQRATWPPTGAMEHSQLEH